MIVASDPLPVLLSLGSVVAYLAAAAWAQARARIGHRGAAVLGLAWLLHGATLWLGITHPPRFGFGPALSMTAWCALLAYGIESHAYPLLPLRWRLALTGALTVVLAWLFPGTPLPGAVSDWLAVHLALGMASYGLFAVAVLHAWLMARAERQMRGAPAALSDTGAEGRHLPLMTLERLTMRFVWLGFVLLTITIAQGMWFGEQLYGMGPAPVAGYSHKTVFSLLSWLVFAALLWGRWRLGWRGLRAVRMVYAGAVLLLLAYVGSHFVLEVLLHRAPGAPP